LGKRLSTRGKEIDGGEKGKIPRVSWGGSPQNFQRKKKVSAFGRKVGLQKEIAGFCQKKKAEGRSMRGAINNLAKFAQAKKGAEDRKKLGGSIPVETSG